MGWSAEDLPDQSGRRIVVTGANSGIGYECALALARRGAEVVLACRNEAGAAAARDRIRVATADGRVEISILDLAELASVRAFAERLDGPVDVLINNAGVMAPPTLQFTADGFERQFGTNHLGHFALTGLLLPALLAAPEPRVVTVSSIAHGSGGRDVLEADAPSAYLPRHAYGNSKLANLLFAAELGRRAAGTALSSTAAHPGIAATNLTASRDGMGAARSVRLVAPLAVRLGGQSARSGALPLLYAASVAAPGSYTGPRRLFEIRGAPGPAKRSALAQDEPLAAELWDLSERLTGVGYPGPASTAP